MKIKKEKKRLYFLLTVVIILVLFSSCLASFSSYSRDGILVRSPEELTEALKTAKSGDTIMLADGVYNNQFFIVDKGGEEGNPLTFKAENSGKAILTGNSRLRIGADYVVADGFYFKDGFLEPMEGGVVEFRMPHPDPARLDFIPCSHSVLRNTVIAYYNNPDRSVDYKWISIYGQYNTVENCELIGKNHSGTALVVWREDPSPQYHNIRYNKIMYIEEDEDGNGSEALRVGTSQESLSDSFTTVEYNYFEQCNGEIEVVSNKSGGNVYRGNTFVDNAGMLTLRHGNGCTVDNNFFFGNGYLGSGGIRVIGEDHIITNNYIEGTMGDSGTFRSAICLTNAFDNGPINSYYQVKNALVANNILVNNQRNFIIGGGASSDLVLPPIDCTIENNLVFSPEGGELFAYYDTPISLTFRNNIMFGASLDLDVSPEEIRIEDPQLREREGLFYPDESTGIELLGQPLAANEVGADWVRNQDLSNDLSFRKRNLFDEEFQVRVVLPWSALTKWSGYQGIILVGADSSNAFIDSTRFKYDIKDPSIMTKMENNTLMIPKGWIEAQLGSAGSTSDPDFISLEEVESAYNRLVYFDERGFGLIIKEQEYYDLLTIRGTLDTIADIYRVTASSDDGNIPGNVLDGSLATRWSAQGDGEFLRFRLEEEETISAAHIAFYKGSDRATFFEIQVSTDNENYTSVYKGQSSGESINMEEFEFSPIQAKFVRLIGHKNTSNDWNSISEVQFYDTEGNAVMSSLKAKGEAYVENIVEPFVDIQLEGTPIPSIDDAFVEKQSPDKTFGVDSDKLRVKSNLDFSIVRISYIKFDVSEVDEINSAIFQISGTVSTNNLPNPVFVFDVFGLENDDWDENTITWNNSSNHEMDSTTVTGIGETAKLIGNFEMSGPGILKKHTVDITDFVKEQKAKDGIVTIMLVDTLMQNGNSDPYSNQRSNESQRPYLYIQ